MTKVFANKVLEEKINIQLSKLVDAFLSIALDLIAEEKLKAKENLKNQALTSPLTPSCKRSKKDLKKKLKRLS